MAIVDNAFYVVYIEYNTFHVKQFKEVLTMSKRVNITVSDSVYETLRTISEDYGMPISSLGSMAIMTWLEQKQALVAMGDLKGLLNQAMVAQEVKK
jgi:hypothetical protein